MRKINVLKYLWILGLSVMLSACGWHLRGQTPLPAELQVLAIEPSNGYLLFQRALRSALKAANVQVVSMSAKPGSVLYLLHEQYSARSWVLNQDGETQENIIHYELKFKLTDADGINLLDEQTIVLERTQRVNPNTLLSQIEEERLLLQEMREDAAQQMIRRLSKIQVSD